MRSNVQVTRPCLRDERRSTHVTSHCDNLVAYHTDMLVVPSSSVIRHFRNRPHDSACSDQWASPSGTTPTSASSLRLLEQVLYARSALLTCFLKARLRGGGAEAFAASCERGAGRGSVNSSREETQTDKPTHTERKQNSSAQRYGSKQKAVATWQRQPPWQRQSPRGKGSRHVAKASRHWQRQKPPREAHSTPSTHLLGSKRQGASPHGKCHPPCR